MELILASPAETKKQVADMERQYNQRYAGKSSKEAIQDLMCEHIIKNYSYYTAFAGGVTALAGIQPSKRQSL